MTEMTEHERTIITKYDLMYEQRMTRVESVIEILMSDIKEIKTDLRWMLGIWIGFSAIMLSLMAKGFHWI